MDPRALALQLGQSIKETPEYQAVQAARAKADEHEAARIMLRDLRKREGEYRQALLAGKADEEAAKELRKLAEIVGHNPYIRELLTAEARLAELVVSLQNQVMAASGLVEPAALEESEANAQGG